MIPQAPEADLAESAAAGEVVEIELLTWILSSRQTL